MSYYVNRWFQCDGSCNCPTCSRAGSDDESIDRNAVCVIGLKKCLDCDSEDMNVVKREPTPENEVTEVGSCKKCGKLIWERKERKVERLSTRPMGNSYVDMFN